MQNITLQDQTFEKLQEMIIKTDLYPGQKISESNLVQLLGVGRTPIRESLKQLKKQGTGLYISTIRDLRFQNRYEAGDAFTFY